MRDSIRGHGGRHCFSEGSSAGLITRALVTGVFFLLAALGARCATETWHPGGASGGNGTWNTSLTPNWNSSQTWTNGNSAVFGGAGGTVTVVNPSASAVTFSASGPYLLKSGTLELTGSNVTVNSAATISSEIISTAGLNESGTAALTLTGSANLGLGEFAINPGTVNINSSGSVSDGNALIDKGGTVTVSGAGTKWTTSANLEVGYAAKGTLQISAGGSVLTSGNGYGGLIGYTLGSSGTVTITGIGSNWTNAADLYVGVYGSGTMLIENGASASSGVDAYYGGTIGYDSGSKGTVTVTGTGSNWTNIYDLYVGFGGTGTLLIEDGGTVSTGADATYGGLIGNDAGSAGIVTVTGTGSKWTNSQSLYAGYYGSGTLVVSSGGAVSNEEGYIGENAGATGAATVTGKGSKWTNSEDLYVGDDGNGTLLVSNGGLVTDGNAYIGNGYASVGGVTVSGTGSTWTNSEDLDLGHYGAGTLLIEAGAVVSDVTAYLGLFAEASGTLTVSGIGSKWINSGGLYIAGDSLGNGGTGLLRITAGGSVSSPQTTVWNGGMVAFGKNGTLGGALTVKGGTLTLVDGELQIVTLSGTTAIDAGSSLGFDVGAGSDRIVFSRAGLLTVSGTSFVDLYGLSGQVTPGTDVLIGAGTSSSAGRLALGDVYNTGNFKYSLLSTATSEDVVVTAAPVPLTTAYWKGGQDNIWSILVGGTATNWRTTAAGTADPLLTPSATSNVIFSASSPASEGDTVLGTNMTIKSLTFSDTNAVLISGYNPLGTNTLSDTGTTGILINSGAGLVTLGANVYLSGTSQTVTVENAQGLAVSGNLSGSFGLYIGGNSAGPKGPSLLDIAAGGSVTAAETKVWDTGTLLFGEHSVLNSPLTVDGATLTLLNGQLQTVTLTNPVTITAGSTLDFEVGNIPDEVAFSGNGKLTMSGASTVNLYGLSGLVTSGTHVLIGAATSGHLALGNLYNGGNFTYSLVSTATSEDVVVKAAASPLTTAYWKGGRDNIWSILVGGTGTNWATTLAGTTDPHLTPSATTNVIFSATSPANEGHTVLGTDMTIKSLTVSDTNAVVISGSDPNTWLGVNTLTISGLTGAPGITVNSGAGILTFGAGIYLTGSSQTVAVKNVAGLLVTGDLGGSAGLIKSGGGVLTLTGSGNFAGQTVAVEAGSLDIESGGAMLSEYADIGEIAGSTGFATVTGKGSTWTNTDDFFVGNSGTGTLLISNGGSVVSGETDFGGVLGNAAGATGVATVTGSGSNWTSSAAIDIGESGYGNLQINSGGAVTSVYGYLGGNAGSRGIVTVTGSGSIWNISAGLYVGNSGTGTLSVENAGSISATGYANTFVGSNAGSVGLVTVTGAGSKLSNGGDFIVGDFGTGTLQIAAGGSVSDGDNEYGALVGASGGAQGTVTVTGSGSSWANSGDLTIGYYGTGTLLIIADGLVTNGQSNYGGVIGYFAGSTGQVTVTGIGSKWTGTGSLYVGYDGGKGTLNITSGGAVTDVAGSIGGYATLFGGDPDSNGTVTVSGSGSTWTNTGELIVGNSGVGNLVVSGAGTVSSGESVYGGVIGNNAGASGSVTITGSGSSWTESSSLSIGYSGNGTLLIENGGSVSDQGGSLGVYPGSSGTVTVTGSGSLWTEGGGYIGDSGSGTLLITAGGHVVCTSDSAIGSSPGGSGVVRVSGAGSTWTNEGNLSVGGYFGTGGTGYMSISGGGAVGDYYAYIGQETGCSGTVTVSGTGSSWTSSTGLYVGGNEDEEGGIGSLNVTNGGTVGAPFTVVWGPGTVGLGENAIYNGQLDVVGGTLTLVDGRVQTATLTSPAGFYVAGSNVDFELGNGSDKIALSGTGSLTFSTATFVNLFGLSGQVTSGTDVIISGTSSSELSLGNVYNGGNFTYSLVSTATSENVVVTSAPPLTTAYWKGEQDNIWSILVGGTATNWTTNAAGTLDPLLTPSSTTNVIFSANAPANEGNTVLGTNVTIQSLTVSDTNAVVISGSDPDPWMGADTLTISGAAGIVVNKGAGPVTIGANVFLSGNAKTIAVNNAAGVVISGSTAGVSGIAKSGTGTLTLTGAGTNTGATAVNAGTLALTTGSSNTASLGNTSIIVASGATFSTSLGTSHFSNAVIAGSTGAGTAGASLTLSPGSAFTMADSPLLAFYLRQETSFFGPAFTIGGASGVAPTLTFGIGNAAAGTDIIDVTKTVTVLATGGRITIDALAGDASITAGSYDIITSAGGFSGSGGNGFTLTDATLVLDGTTYDLSLVHSTAADEILTVSVAPAPDDILRPSFAIREDSTDALLGNTLAAAAIQSGAPLVSVAAVPEPGTAKSLLTVFGIVAIWTLRRRKFQASSKS